jgi:hypothetical protein
MNAILSKYGMLVLGALLGGGSGFLFAKHVLEEEAVKEEEMISDQVIDETDPDTGTRLANLIVEQTLANDKGGNWDGSTEVEGEKIVVTNEKTLKKKKKKVPVTDYNSLSKKPLRDVAKDHNIDIEPQEELPAPDLTQPYVITLEDYALDKKQDKIVLTHYDLDDVVCDEGKKVITNVDEMIGSDGLLKFGQQSGDPDSVYIRNINLGTDFEVVRLNKSYEEDVLGVGPKKKRPDRNTSKSTKVSHDDREDE